MSNDEMNRDTPPPTPDPLIDTHVGKHTAPDESSVIDVDTNVTRTGGPPDLIFAPAATIIEKADLAQEAHHLADEVTALRETATTLTHRTTRNGWGVAITTTGLILDIALSVLAFMLLSNQTANNTQIAANNTRIIAINSQIVASIHEQCSLYNLLIPSYREVARQASPLGPAGYDSAFRRMQLSADKLQCGIPHVIKP